MPDDPVPDMVPRSELEREVAAERRKRRWVQAALAVAVVLLLAGGVAFAWREAWHEARRAAERAAWEAERHRWEERARGAMNAAILQADELRKNYRFKEAAAAIDLAGQLAADNAPDAVPAVDRAKADLAFVRELDDIRMQRSAWVADADGKGRFDTAAAAPGYRKAFEARGLDVMKTPPDELVRRIAAASSRADLVAALDDWAVHEPNPAVRDRVRAVDRP